MTNEFGSGNLTELTFLFLAMTASAPLTLPPDELAEMQRRRDEMVADPSIAIEAKEVWRRVESSLPLLETSRRSLDYATPHLTATIGSPA